MIMRSVPRWLNSTACNTAMFIVFRATSWDVGLTNKLDVKGRKYLARGEPVQRAHGAVVAPALAGRQLPAKVVERPEAVGGIASRWLRSTFPLCRGVYGLISLCRIPSRAASASNSVGNSSGCWQNRFVNSKPLSVCTHSTVIPLRLNAATTFRRKSAEEYVLCSSYAPSTRYLDIRRSPCTGTASIPALQCSCAARPLRRSVRAPLAAPSVHTASA